MNNNRLPDAARTALEEGPTTPPWWPVVQIALLVAFAGFVLWSLGSSGADTTAGTDPVGDAPPVVVADPSPTEAGGQDPVGGGQQTVAVDDGQGATVEVAADAVAQGRAYARALFTTDFTEVSFLPGIAPPTLPSSYPDPQVGEPRVLNVTEGQVRLSFPVDPDGDGDQALREVSVTVLLQDGNWVVRGA